jgi:putative tricarboxylic transport membrane protein
MRKSILPLVIALHGVSAVHAAPPHALAQPECIAPAKPGGGFDLTCKLAQAVLQETKLTGDVVRINYMPGGIGALAYNAIIRERPSEPNVVVAFSSGSLLNLAQGKFGKYNGNEVRWLAIIAADHAALVVRTDSPIHNLKDLEKALRADPNKIVFGGGGTVGSQDWMKTALTARAAGVDHKTLRFVAFEGGGEALSALVGGHVHVLSGDVGEALNALEAGAPIRVLAVLSDRRLPGRLASVPTAREQGYDLSWPVFRGLYMGPQVSDVDYRAWVDALDKALASQHFHRLREQRGLFELTMTGAQAESFVKRSIADYRRLADQMGLRVLKP